MIPDTSPSSPHHARSHQNYLALHIVLTGKKGESLHDIWSCSQEFHVKLTNYKVVFWIKIKKIKIIGAIVYSKSSVLTSLLTRHILNLVLIKNCRLQSVEFKDRTRQNQYQIGALQSSLILSWRWASTAWCSHRQRLRPGWPTAPWSFDLERVYPFACVVRDVAGLLTVSTGRPQKRMRKFSCWTEYMWIMPPSNRFNSRWLLRCPQGASIGLSQHPSLLSPHPCCFNTFWFSTKIF